MSDDELKIIVPKPDSEGAHAIVSPVDAMTSESMPEKGKALLATEEGGAMLTAEQCFSLSDTFNHVGEVLERYHDE